MFRSVLLNEIIPFIDSTYRTDEQDRTLTGHSFGGLFCTYLLLTAPESFRRYIIVSPSLWYDDKYCFRLEEEYAEQHGSLHARVFYCAGEWENLGNGRPKMADEMFEMVRTLRSRDYTGLEVTGVMFEKETHNSIFPGAFSRGIRYVFES